MTQQTIDGWLTDAYDYERPRRGQMRDGVILKIDEEGITVDVGHKCEGFVYRSDVERLGAQVFSELQPGQEIATQVVTPEDREGNLILSMYRARLEKDWRRAHEMLESGEVWQGKVTGFNRGGLTVNFGRIYGFVPGSHLWARDKTRFAAGQREEVFKDYVDQELPLTIIEVDKRRRRLILSERIARKKLRQRRLEQLLTELLEGQVCRGIISRICDFGAFVDLGGADGLIHVSELSWRRIRHPREVVRVGEEVQVHVLRLDRQRKRVGLSLKRLQPDPWELLEVTYEEDQLVSGRVTSIADFGAFAVLNIGVEGLIHVSELADPPPENPRTVVQLGDELVLRVTRIEPDRHRIGLSLKRVSEEERAGWLRASITGDAGVDASDDAAVMTAAAAAMEMPVSVGDVSVDDRASIGVPVSRRENAEESAVAIAALEEVVPGVREHA